MDIRIYNHSHTHLRDQPSQQWGLKGHLFMESLFQDLKFGLKLLWKDKGFTITALLTLALCIGANSTIFSMVNTVLLRPLPFEESQNLVTVFNSYPNAGAPIGSNASGDYFFRRESIEAFGELGLYQFSGNTIGESGTPERVNSMRVTPSLFPMLRVDPLMGRNFVDEEMDQGNEFKVILSYGFWQERYAGDQSILEQEMRIDGNTFSIIGVMPEDFRFLGTRDNRFFVPFVFSEEQRGIESLHSNQYEMIARLAPGTTIEQAVGQLDILNQSLTEQSPIPNAMELLKDVGFHVQVHNLQQFIVRDISTTLYMLWAGVFFVLLIGCVNIANLMLVRSNIRTGELATRFAIGASRIRLTRQLISESVLLSIIGGTLGLIIASLGMNLMEVLGADELPRGAEISLDSTVLIFTLVISIAAGVFFGALPLFRLFKFDLSTVFRQEGRSTTAGKGAIFTRNTLVVAQISIAFTLLIGAGLMFTSFRRMIDVDPGFDTDSVLTGFMALPETKYGEADSRRLFMDRLLNEVNALPGVSQAAITSQLPFSGSNNSSVIVPEGYELQPGESILSPYSTFAGSGYFKAMGIPLLEGRTFDDTDNQDSEQVVILDEWLARRYWPDNSPIGKRMLQGVPGMEDEEENFYTVIGVVGQIKQNDLTETTHSGSYYHSYKQNPRRYMALVVKTDIEPASLTNGIRASIARIDPDLPFYGIETLESRISDSLLQFRTPMMLLLVFAGVALFLAAVGIYGVLAYSVTQRTRELGIMIALGSSSKHVFKTVVGQGLKVLAIGLVIGICSTLLLAQLIQALLFGVEPTDPMIFTAVSVLLALVVILACVLPARRATRIDPVATLNYE